MRVLFLSDSESPDYGEALAFSGLVACLGYESVYDYPVKPSFHNGYMEQIPYGSFGWMDKGTPPVWESPMPGVNLIDFYGFDMVVAGSCRKEPWDALANQGICADARRAGVPIVVCDGWDTPHM